MRRTLPIFTVLSLLLLSFPVLAKETKAKKAVDPQAMMETYKKIATPGEPHKLFATLTGNWTTTAPPRGVMKQAHGSAATTSTTSAEPSRGCRWRNRGTEDLTMQGFRAREQQDS